MKRVIFVKTPRYQARPHISRPYSRIYSDRQL